MHFKISRVSLLTHRHENGYCLAVQQARSMSIEEQLSILMFLKGRCWAQVRGWSFNSFLYSERFSAI